MLGGTPVGVHVTRHARRLARRHASHDAGRSPLGAPPWRFWALRVPRFPPRVTRLGRSFGGSGSVTASSSRPGLSAWRAGSLPPGATGASRYRRTPHLAPPSGSPPETLLDERGCESSTIDTFRSQVQNVVVTGYVTPPTSFLAVRSRRLQAAILLRARPQPERLGAIEDRRCVRCGS